MNDEVRDEGTLSDEEKARAVLEQLKQLRVVDLAYDMMVSLVTVGYQKMGLTRETHELRDLDDARLAIELLRADLEVVEAQGGGLPTADLHGTLAQMQINYARAVQASGAAPVARGPAAGPAPVAAEEPPAAEKGTPAGEAPAARKPPGKEPAAKEPAAKEPAAKKPAARKPAAKKPARKKPGTAGGGPK